MELLRAIFTDVATLCLCCDVIFLPTTDVVWRQIGWHYKVLCCCFLLLFVFLTFFLFSFSFFFLPIEIVVWRNRVKHYEGKQSTRFGQRSCVFVGRHWRITMWMFSVSKNRRGREMSQIYLLFPGLVTIVCVCVCVVHAVVIVVVVVCSGLWGTFIAVRTRFLRAFLYLGFKQTGLYVCLVGLAAVHAAFPLLLSALPTSSADVKSVSSFSPKPTKLPYSYNQPAGHCVIINRAVKSSFLFVKQQQQQKQNKDKSLCNDVGRLIVRRLSRPWKKKTCNVRFFPAMSALKVHGLWQPLFSFTLSYHFCLRLKLCMVCDSLCLALHFHITFVSVWNSAWSVTASV